jgi:hypothetical protein
MIPAKEDAKTRLPSVMLAAILRIALFFPIFNNLPEFCENVIGNVSESDYILLEELSRFKPIALMKPDFSR